MDSDLRVEQFDLWLAKLLKLADKLSNFRSNRTNLFLSVCELLQNLRCGIVDTAGIWVDFGWVVLSHLVRIVNHYVFICLSCNFGLCFYNLFDFKFASAFAQYFAGTICSGIIFLTFRLDESVLIILAINAAAAAWGGWFARFALSLAVFSFYHRT